VSCRLAEADGTLREPASSVPADLVLYKRTPDFTEQTVPAGLLRAHSTKDGVWGRIQVAEGELIYLIVDPRREEREITLRADHPGVIEPTILHQVQLRGVTRFFVEFFRKPLP
jgi:tellurite resistance-related uncharacterized protein